jgi:hypothetical protein
MHREWWKDAMAGHKAPLAKQIPARRSAALRCLAVAAAALGIMTSPALAFSPPAALVPAAGQRVPAEGTRCRASLSLQMAAAPDQSRKSR